MSKECLIQQETLRKGLNVPKAVAFIAGEVAGTGVLALPRAIENTGWTGIPLLVFFLSMSAYSGHILGKSWTMASRLFDECKGHVSDPYPLLAEKTYGKKGRIVVSVMIHISLFGAAVVLLLLGAGNVQLLIKYAGYNMSICYWLIVTSACVLPFTWFGTPKDFWLIAVGALCTTAVSVVILIVSLSVNTSGTTVTHSEIQLQGYALSVGTIMFAFAGHPAIPTIQVDMKRSSNFTTAVILAFILIGCMYVPVACMGYFMVGDKLTPNVLKALPPGPLEYVVTTLMTAHLFSAFIIFMNPVCQHFESALNVPKEFTWKRCLSRLFIVLCILFVAETVPRFDAILSFLGGSVFAMLDFVFPVMFYKKLSTMSVQQTSQQNNDENRQFLNVEETRNDESDTPFWVKFCNYEIIFVAVLGGLIATVSSVIVIIDPTTFSLPCYINHTST